MNLQTIHFGRKLYTLAELTKLKVLAITVKSTVINPDEWLYTKYPDGCFYPYTKIDQIFTIKTDKTK